MQVKVELNYLRIAPRKTRQIADLIRGKMAEEAASILQFVVRKPALPILKLLNSGIATIKNDFKLDPAKFYISKITADEGPKLKRSRPVARGSAHPIWKRTSHVALVLEEK
ncbi:50S ribosomal protein L22 [Patescibacteria group bacterium]|nr:50S ribosomal protein L22 [Patescibacteria group bacterium]